MRLLWLPDVLRSAGLTVHEVSGWRERGDRSFDPRGIIVHETRGSRTSTDAGEISVLLNGSVTAPPPIAQLYLSRTGDWHVIASGRCNHVRVGWAGPFKGVGNLTHPLTVGGKPVYLSAGAAVDARVVQTSGGPLSIAQTSRTPNLTIWRVA